MHTQNIYKKIIKHLDIGYFKSGEDGIIIDHNPAFGKIFGYGKDESLIGIPAIDLWENPEDFNRYQEELIEKRKLRDYIHRARKKNGQVIILHTHSHLYKNKEKNRYEAEGTIFDITEKFELEQKLKESEKNYRNIIENAQDAIVIFGLDGRLKYTSPQLSKILGREIKLGIRAFNGIHPDDEKNLVKAFKRAVREKRTFTNEEFEFRAFHNDGHYIWLSSLTKNYYDDEGNLDGFIALLKDITEKKETQIKLIESEKKYQNIIENSKDAIAVIGLDGKFKYISPQLSKILGKEVNLQTQLFSDIHPEDLNRLMELFSIAINQKKVLTDLEVEFRALHNNGHYIWLASSSKTYHDKNGKVIGFITLLRDITEKKEAEQKLVESEKKYREILDNLEQGYYEVDIKGIYIFTNEFQANYFGLSPDEMIGKSYKDLYDKETEKRLFEIYSEVYQKDIPRTIREIEIVGPDGTKQTYETSIFLKRDSNNNKIGFYGTTLDISERKKWERKLIESEKKYREILNNIDQGFYEVDLKGNYIFMNESYANFFGLSSDEIIGKSYKDLYDKEGEKEIFEIFNEIYRKDIPKTIREFEVVRPDGRKHTYELSIYLKRNSNNKKIGFYGASRDISYRKEMEEILIESEKKYREILDNLEQGYYEVDFNGNYTLVNEYYAKFYGYSPDEMIGKNYGVSFDKETKNNIFEIYNQMYRENTPKLIREFEIMSPEGVKRTIENIIYLKRDSNGKKICFYGTIYDISERKKWERKLEESEKKYRHLFNSTPYAIWLVNLKGIIIDCNNTMNQYMTEFKVEDLIGKNFREIINMFISRGDPGFKDLDSVFNKRFKLLLKQGYLDPIEFQISRGDGKKFWITLETSFVTIDNEKIIQIFIKDITERKEAELKIKESEEKYRLISENANDLIMILDGGGNFLYCNETFKRVMGFSPEELLGKNAGDYAHPDDLIQARKDFQNTILYGTGINIARYRCKDGTYKWIEAKGNFTYDEENNPIRDFIVARDITERKEMEEKLKKSEEELRKLNIELEQKVRERTKELEKKNIELTKLDKTKDDFITMAAHELKTPLISVAGYTDYILTAHIDDLSVDVKNDLLIVQRNIDRLQNLMNQLLDVMKIESHKIELKLKLENISNIIYRCLHELNYLFKEKDHEMILNLDNEILINVDSNRIFQVFSNLISNATKFTQKGGKIEISAKKEAMHYLFEIKDNGIGLLEEDFKRIFKKFETIERMSDTYNQTGSGLGLYISKGFVEAHGGKMWASSEGLNKGTTIQFTIPI